MQTFTGLEYIKLDIASAFGLDKESWDNRLAWFDQNWENIGDLIDQAEEPARFYAGIKAYCDAIAGRPTGFMTSLDATSSGLQILAALTGDRSAAMISNVVDTGDRRDAYTVVYDYMASKYGIHATIDRSMTKQAIMTSLYGSTAMPKKVFGEGELLRTFYQAMEQLAPACWELNETMLEIWDPNVLSYAWVLPDNFHVNFKVFDYVTDTVHFNNEPFDVVYKVNQPVKQGRSLGANMIHSIDGMIVREMTRRCDYDPEQIEYVRRLIAGEIVSVLDDQTITDDDDIVRTLWDNYQLSGYLSARILDHLNGRNLVYVDPAVIQEMIDSLPPKSFKVVSVHDCFRCLPHYGNSLRAQYNLQLQLIANSNLLQFVIGQIMQRPVQIGKLDYTLAQDISQANYALS